MLHELYIVRDTMQRNDFNRVFYIRKYCNILSKIVVTVTCLSFLSESSLNRSEYIDMISRGPKLTILYWTKSPVFPSREGSLGIHDWLTVGYSRVSRIPKECLTRGKPPVELRDETCNWRFSVRCFNLFLKRSVFLDLSSLRFLSVRN